MADSTYEQQSRSAIDNPIINSAYHEPHRHFAFDENDVTDRIVEGRRRSTYFTPIPGSRRSQDQLDLGLDHERVEENKLINQIRDRVSVWRQAGYPGVTNTTRHLLDHWGLPPVRLTSQM